MPEEEKEPPHRQRFFAARRLLPSIPIFCFMLNASNFPFFISRLADQPDRVLFLCKIELASLPDFLRLRWFDPFRVIIRLYIGAIGRFFIPLLIASSLLQRLLNTLYTQNIFSGNISVYPYRSPSLRTAIKRAQKYRLPHSVGVSGTL